MPTRQIRTSVEIDADSAKVWSVLSDFTKYGEWNPFLKSIEGKLQPGEYINVTFSNGFKMTPRILRADENKELRWQGKLACGGLFDGQHFFTLTDLGNGKTRLDQGEDFNGILLPLLPGLLKETEENFEKMNLALKAKAEQA